MECCVGGVLSCVDWAPAAARSENRATAAQKIRIPWVTITKLSWRFGVWQGRLMTDAVPVYRPSFVLPLRSLKNAAENAEMKHIRFAGLAQPEMQSNYCVSLIASWRSGWVISPHSLLKSSLMEVFSGSLRRAMANQR